MAMTPERESVASPEAALSPPQRRRVHADFIIAPVILMLCGVVFSLTLTFDTIPAALAQGMGPAAFPRLLLGVIVLLALTLAWSARGRTDEVREPIPPMVYLTAAAMVAFMGLLWLAGTIVAMCAAVIGMGALWGERRWTLLVASGVGLALSIYVLFTKGFGIQLPSGLLGNRLF